MSQVEWWGELKANWEPPVDEMEEKMKVAELEQMKAGPPSGNGNGGPPRK